MDSQVALEVKNLPAKARDMSDVGLISGLGRSPGEGNGYPLQYSCLENSMGRGGWWAMVHGVAKSQTRLSNTFSSHKQVKNISVSLVRSFTIQNRYFQGKGFE